MSRIDLDKFPTSESAKRMLKRVSPVYQNAYTAKWLYQVMGMEWDKARELVLSLRDQAFTQTVTWGIEMQEHKYSIEPDDNLSLEERRARLYRKKTKHYPLNPWFMENYMKSAWNIYADVDETYGWGVLRLGVLYDDDNNFRKMLKDMRGIKPSHLSWALYYDVFFDDTEDVKEDTEIIVSAGPDGWQEWYPYGINNPNVPKHDGSGVHSDYICHNGIWLRNGTIPHDPGWPGALRHGGLEDMAHDYLAVAAGYEAEETYTIQGEHFGCWMGLDFSDTVTAVDGNGEIDIDVVMRRNGAAYHDGCQVHGGRRYTDALGDGLSIKRIERNGRWSRGDTSIARGQTLRVA